MQMRQRRHAAIAASALSLLLVACGGSDGGSTAPAAPAAPVAPTGPPAVVFEPLTIVAAHSTAEDFPYHDGFLKFKEVIESETGGVVKVEIFPNGQLGDSRQMAEAVLTGDIQVTIGAGPLGEVAPAYNLAAVPFLIRGFSHLEAIRDSDVGALWVSRLEEQSGLKMLGWFTTGESSIQTVNKPVRSVADLAGQKIRVQNNEALVNGFAAMGANPTPISFGELYTSLQQGVVEGAHLDWLSIFSIKANEVLRYSTTPDVPVLAEPRFLIADQAWFDGLQPELQEIVARASLEASRENFSVHQAKQGAAIDQARREFTEVTDINEAEFVATLEPVWREIAEKAGASDILEGILRVRPSS